LPVRVAPVLDQPKIVPHAIEVEINVDPEQAARVDTVLKTLVGHREDLERKKLLGTRDGNGATEGRATRVARAIVSASMPLLANSRSTFMPWETANGWWPDVIEPRAPH
jgi:hypothetical protein